MGFLAPLLGGLASGVIGDIFGNSQNKANQKNADNQAAQSRQFDAQALQTALNNYSAYLSANPSPASQYGNIKAPQSVYGGQTQVNSPTTSVNGGPNGQQVQSMVAALLSGQGGQQGTPQGQVGGQSIAGSLQQALMPQTHMNGTPQGQVGGRRVPLPANVAASTVG